MAKASVKEGYMSKAVLRNFRVSPRKARLVVDMIRGQKIERALEVLDAADKKTAPVVKKLVLSAVANATFDNSVDVDGLFIRRAWVDEGRTLHRNIPRAHGRATPLKKRHSHITVILDEIGA